MAACDDLENIRAVIYGGAKSVKYADKELTYRDLSELKKIERDLEILCNGEGARKSGRRYAEHHRGL